MMRLYSSIFVIYMKQQFKLIDLSYGYMLTLSLGHFSHFQKKFKMLHKLLWFFLKLSVQVQGMCEQK